MDEFTLVQDDSNDDDDYDNNGDAMPLSLYFVVRWYTAVTRILSLSGWISCIYVNLCYFFGKNMFLTTKKNVI